MVFVIRRKLFILSILWQTLENNTSKERYIMTKKIAPEVTSPLRSSIIEMPNIIRKASGIVVYGRHKEISSRVKHMNGSAL